MHTRHQNFTRLPAHTFVNDPALVAAVNKRLETESRLRIRAARRRDGPLVDRIASAMREMFFTGETVTIEALTLRGFTRAELSEANIAAARDKANLRAVRQIGGA